MTDLELGSVLRKTESGVDAIKLRDRTLAPKLRMMLIVVDGSKTVAQLVQPMPDPHETRQVLAALLSLGYVCQLDLPKATPLPVPILATAPREEPDPSLKAAIRRTTRLLEDLLGPTCEPLCLQLEKCSSFDQFTAKVHDLRRIVAAMRSEKKAEEFLGAALSP